MKRSVLPLLLLLALVLTGCGGPAAPETTAPTVPALITTEPPTTVPPETTQAVTEPPTTAAPETTQDPAERERELFYHDFWELDPETTDQWLADHPEYMENGYAGIAVNQAWLTDKGLDLYTTQGHQVLAIDAANGILIVRIWPDGSRGVLAIAKDPARLQLCAAEKLGTVGEKIGSIARRNNGLLAITGSGFLDPGGAGNGGSIAGYCMCGGKTYGTPMGWNYARFELHEDNWADVTHAEGPAAWNTTDCMEFEPAILIDGEPQDVGIWDGENPRACIGQNRRGEILMLGVEGRFSDSPGCSVALCGEIMLQYEGLNAVNCDGGTTAILWYRGEPILRCSNRTTPDGRYLPNAWVYTKAD